MAVSLQKITAERGNKILIDCSGVRIADLSGLQLLYVWMQCASLWGVESELVNLPDRLQQTIHTLGVEHCFGGTA
jgi:anti-anti-sigma regulatory factor